MSDNRWFAVPPNRQNSFPKWHILILVKLPMQLDMDEPRIIDFLFFLFESWISNLFLKRGWPMIAHERIELRCSAYLWGVAILVKVAGEIKVNDGGCC